MFDGAHTQSYSIDDEYDTDTEEEMLERERNHFYDLTPQSSTNNVKIQ